MGVETHKNIMAFVDIAAKNFAGLAGHKIGNKETIWYL